MSPSVEPVPAGAIAVTNVRPAYEASLHFGATESELATSVGLTRACLDADGATVSGSATYAHMEAMFAKPAYPQFVVAAASLHTLPSLGVVGLACKTVATLEEALACHQRYQHLTNRTARYDSYTDEANFTFEEERFGPARLGSLLISDYTMLVAATLIQQCGAQMPPPHTMRSRRAQMDQAERSAFEAFTGATIELGARRAALVYDVNVLSAPVASADAELAEYFASLLERAGSLTDRSESETVAKTRVAIRDGLTTGAVTLQTVARRLGMGARTLQRRLSSEGLTFGEMLESTRRRLVHGYLTDPSLSLAEIAYLLGYREQASFFRAFRGWHEQTPTQYREALRTTTP
ncbi:MAG: AraC family transcriptional regulator [Deltaproteobacteria bacterium]|nr:AraC family transcriptional regulator [Deltaproteobacteria bacterium]